MIVKTAASVEGGRAMLTLYNNCPHAVKFLAVEVVPVNVGGAAVVGSTAGLVLKPGGSAKRDITTAVLEKCNPQRRSVVRSTFKLMMHLDPDTSNQPAYSFFSVELDGDTVVSFNCLTSQRA